MYPKRQNEKGRPSRNQADTMDQEFNLKKIMKEIESFSNFLDTSSLLIRKFYKSGGSTIKLCLPTCPWTFNLTARLLLCNMEIKEGVREREGGISGREGSEEAKTTFKRSTTNDEKQKKMEQKLLKETVALGHFGGKFGNAPKRLVEKRKPEHSVLKSSEGYFRNGVLDVKHLLRPAPSRDMFNGGKMIKGSGKKNHGKKKGGGRKRH